MTTPPSPSTFQKHPLQNAPLINPTSTQIPSSNTPMAQKQSNVVEKIYTSARPMEM